MLHELRQISSAAKIPALLGLIAIVLAAIQPASALSIYPTKDGTLVDGGGFGVFDGSADAWDWYFNGSSYEGTITLSTETQGAELEHRLVWEYSLSTVTLTPPVSATLTFTLRGAPIWPFPDVDVHVYNYPADLLETPDDFEAGPSELQGWITVVPYQAPTIYALNISAKVNDALISGLDKVAFRMQVDPTTANAASQVFLDAVDSDPTTKPLLTISVLGDAGGNGQVDIGDHSDFVDCMTGPGRSVAPACADLDFDQDQDVDLVDFDLFESILTNSLQ